MYVIVVKAKTQVMDLCICLHPMTNTYLAYTSVCIPNQKSVGPMYLFVVEVNKYYTYVFVCIQFQKSVGLYESLCIQGQASIWAYVFVCVQC